MPAKSLEQVRNLCMRRGFVFPGSAAYGGVASFWDYGPLGVEMLNNIKQAWWQDAVYAREDMEGLDAAILMSRKVWQHSGHEATFSDPLVDNRADKKRDRLDHLLREQSMSTIADLIEAVIASSPSQQDALRAIGRAGTYLTQSEADLHPTFAEYIREFNSTGSYKFGSEHREPFVRALCDMLRAQHLLKGRTAFGVLIDALSKQITGLVSGGELLKQCNVVHPDTGTVGDWTNPRNFNLMFVSHVGPVQAAPGTDEEESARVYLRPETAQGIFMNFAHVQRSMARKVPFGIAQIGKAFRNEITPGNFIFRTREFEQMEIEFFIKPPQFVGKDEKTDEQWHEEWIDQRFRWWLKYAGPPTRVAAVPAAPVVGVSPATAPGETPGADAGWKPTTRDTRATRFRKRAQAADELAHYAKATTDIEYLFPGALGWGEIEGVANRTDFDLSAHSKDIPEEDRKRLKLEENKDSNEKFDYFDPDAKQRYVPWVIEPSAGVTRAMLTFLCEAYDEELVKEPTKQEVDQIKSDAAQIKNNAEKKIKQAEKDIAAGKEAKHNPVQVRAFLDKLEDVVTRLPESLGEVLLTLDHPGAADLEPVKKFRPPTEKFMEDISRTVLRLHPALAPIKLAVFPLKKNKPEIVELAKSIKRKFQKHFRTVYDDSAGIGRLYRRQDEIGTPFCITVDFESLEDGTVTVRERDTMSQERVAIDQLEAYILPQVRLG